MGQMIFQQIVKLMFVKMMPTSKSTLKPKPDWKVPKLIMDTHVHQKKKTKTFVFCWSLFSKLMLNHAYF